MHDMAETKNKMYCYEYPMPAVTVDMVIFGWDGQSLRVLLIRRGNEPFAGCWAVPGGFIEIEEELDAAARRELWEETGMKNVEMEPFGCFGTPGRDPRGRTVAQAYVALVRKERMSDAAAGDDAAETRWFELDQLPSLAFDHEAVLSGAVEAAKEKSLRGAFALHGLAEEFSMEELRRLYGAIWGRTVNAESFAIWIGKQNILEKVISRDGFYRWNGRKRMAIPFEMT